MSESRIAQPALKDATDRVRAVAEAQYEFLWRSLRRLGVAASDVEDAAQQALIVLMRRIDSIQPGSEPAFLFGTAMRLAQESRKRYATARARADRANVEPVHEPQADPEQLLDQQRARQALDRVLDDLPMELRAVFVLADLEEMTMARVAEVLAIPAGTVASRLRRARELFAQRAAAVKAQLAGVGDDR
jgi:RNA polymerase sigma-70 factor (ECF subfamily)